MNTKLAIVLAWGDIFKNGNVNHNDPSIFRLKASLEALKLSFATIICTAGYGRKNPELLNKDRDFSLARQIGHYFIEHIPKEQKENNLALYFRPHCWSTENEIKYGIKIAIKENMVNTKDVVELHIASNKQHLKRIKMYTDRYAPKNWVVKLIPVKDGLHGPINYFMELGKRVRDYIKFNFLKKWYSNNLYLKSSFSTLFYFIKIC